MIYNFVKIKLFLFNIWIIIKNGGMVKHKIVKVGFLNHTLKLYNLFI